MKPYGIKTKKMKCGCEVGTNHNDPRIKKIDSSRKTRSKIKNDLLDLEKELFSSRIITKEERELLNKLKKRSKA